MKRMLALVGAGALTVALAAPAMADGSVVYSGQGVEGGALEEVVCDADETPYLLWILTANGATSAEIDINGSTGTMTQRGNGAFQFVSEWYDLDTLEASATYEGTANGRPQLVISHGCPGDSYPS